MKTKRVENFFHCTETRKRSALKSLNLLTWYLSRSIWRLYCLSERSSCTRAGFCKKLMRGAADSSNSFNRPTTSTLLSTISAYQFSSVMEPQNHWTLSCNLSSPVFYSITTDGFTATNTLVAKASWPHCKRLWKSDPGAVVNIVAIGFLAIQILGNQAASKSLKANFPRHEVTSSNKEL